MKIAIDAREAFDSHKAGKGQWTKGFLDEILSRHHDITVLADERCDRKGSVIFPSGLSWHWKVARFVRDGHFDLYISPTSFIVPTLLSSRVPIALVIHDLIAFQAESHNKKATFIERLLLSRALKNSKYICTTSESTKQDLLERFDSLDMIRITPIYAGPMCKTVALSIPDNHTILCAGTLCPRKNQLRLIRAYAALPAELRRQYRLVLIGGRGWLDRRIVEHARSVKGVEWKDYVSDDEYQELLNTATVLAHPSLYEGFGMQILDAMQRGIPVLTSDCGSLKEVVCDAAVLVDPESERSITSGLVAILLNEDVRTKLHTVGPIQARKFSWKQTVDLFLEAIA